jgi:maleate isomerase
MRMLLPEELSIHTARLPLQPGADLAERNRRSPSFFVGAIESFGSLPIDAALIAVTGPNYSLSGAAADALDADLRRVSHGPVARASTPIEEALSALGIRSLTLVSPYEPWLTESARILGAARPANR